MAFDPQASCVTEEVFQLPVCMQGDPDTLKLHAAILSVTTWMQDHYIPKDAWDPPYVYRTNYLPDYVSGNDVAALGRITTQASLRGITLPVVLGPLLPPQPNLEVTPEEVTYTAANAGAIADSLGPLLAAMQAATPAGKKWNWWLIGGIVAGVVLLGVAVVGNYNEGVVERAGG